MRTKKEVETALRHMRDVQVDCAARGDVCQGIVATTNVDVLGWVLGENNGFAEVVRECDKIDETTIGTQAMGIV